MLAYGLFLARLNSNSHLITLNNAREYVPGSFRLIQELIDFIPELEKDEYRDVRWVVEELLSIANGLDLGAIHEDLSFRHRRAINRNIRAFDEDEHRLFELDPFIYFYEDYLKAYDPAMRKSRGVYYTPPPVVNFIVRSVDDILKQQFGIRDGLADHNRVTVLDFACGTGTFCWRHLSAYLTILVIELWPRGPYCARTYFKKSIWLRVANCTLHDRSSQAISVPSRRGTSPCFGGA
jgi:type I restriction-modification system DNA methylase subunit